MSTKHHNPAPSFCFTESLLLYIRLFGAATTFTAGSEAEQQWPPILLSQLLYRRRGATVLAWTGYVKKAKDRSPKYLFIHFFKASNILRHDFHNGPLCAVQKDELYCTFFCIKLCKKANFKLFSNYSLHLHIKFGLVFNISESQRFECKKK